MRRFAAAVVMAMLLASCGGGDRCADLAAKHADLERQMLEVGNRQDEIGLTDTAAYNAAVDAYNALVDQANAVRKEYLAAGCEPDI